MRDPDCAIKIMESWVTLDEIKGVITRRYFIDISGKKYTKQFTYWQPFVIHFIYIHQLYNHNNRTNAPIYLDRTWATKFWPDLNFAWYLAVSEVNTDLASDHFKNYGVLKPSMYFWRTLEIECLENTIGLNWIRMENITTVS